MDLLLLLMMHYSFSPIGIFSVEMGQEIELFQHDAKAGSKALQANLFLEQQ